MGAKQSLNRSTELSSINQSIQNEDGELFQKQQCMCLRLQGNKNLKFTLLWETNAIKYCQELKGKQEWIWASQVIEIVKNRTLSRTKFISDFNHLKYMEKEPTHSEKQMTLTQTQINNFKLNLRRSVLLSYGDIANPPRPSKIESQVNPHSTVTKTDKSKTRLGSDMFRQQINNINNDKSIMVIPSRQSLKKSSTQFLRESVINLVEDTMTSLFKGEQKQISKLSVHALDVFVKFTVMLQKHLADPQHKIYEIIQTFSQNLYKNCKSQTKNNVIINNKPRKLSGISEINALELQIIIKDIKKFIVLLTQMVYDYYNIGAMGQFEEGSNHLINNYENIRTIITAILFKNEKFYNFVFGAIKEFNKENEERIQQKYQQLHGKPPQFFTIRREYCLNNASFKKFVQQMSSVQSNIQNFVPEELQSQSQEPYIKCSQALCKITRARTPIAKMKTILECAQLITQTISQFYESNRMKLKNQMLDADQVLSIFCYILTLNKIDNLFSHMFLIDKFATEQQKMSMTGYYFTVIKCAIEENFGENQQDYEDGQMQLVVQEGQRKKDVKQNLQLKDIKADKCSVETSLKKNTVGQEQNKENIKQI